MKNHKICAPEPDKLIWSGDKISFTLASLPWFILFVITAPFIIMNPNKYVLYFLFMMIGMYFLTIFIKVIARKIHRLRVRICYDFETKTLSIQRKRDGKVLLEINMDNIDRIITSENEEDDTHIRTINMINGWRGPHLNILYSSGEFGMTLGEEFKKHWKSKGYSVYVEERGYRLLGHRILYTKGVKLTIKNATE